MLKKAVTHGLDKRFGAFCIEYAESVLRNDLEKRDHNDRCCGYPQVLCKVFKPARSVGQEFCCRTLFESGVRKNVIDRYANYLRNNHIRKRRYGGGDHSDEKEHFASPQKYCEHSRIARLRGYRSFVFTHIFPYISIKG